MKKGFLLITLFSLAFASLMAQEILIPLSGNPVAFDYYQNRPSAKKAGTSDTLELPFIDDFSDSFVEPDPGRWTDKRAYINNQYSESQITSGVATLDAVDFNGSHYPKAGSNPYEADFLTSKPINLDYDPGDNIFLSFYYQAGGLGEIPETSDSLCLDFKDGNSNEWVRVWKMPGSSSRDFNYVILPITDPDYLFKGFQFRFMNYASQSKNNDFPDKQANVDHWNIDYVELDRGRNINDTLHRDVSFVHPLSTLLKDYTSIPWTHLEQAYFTQRAPFLTTSIINLDSITRNVTKSLRITDRFSGFTYNTTPTANDMAAGEIQEFNFEFDYPFEFGENDSAIFDISTLLRTDAFDYKPNDTLKYTQVFSNYYSFDDGNAEAGYGLRGQGTQNASVAVRFNAFREDSLRAVRMHFNQLKDSLNLNYFFYLRIWDDQDGKPGNLIYSKTGVRPAYAATLNGFVTYFLDEPVKVEGPFYVGYTKTVALLSNIGIDLNNPNLSNNFYNLGQGWVNSSIPGALMIRPILSMTPLSTSGGGQLPAPPNITLFPNPASENLSIDAGEFDPYEMSGKIYDLSGRMILEFGGEEFGNLNISGIHEGVYLIRIENRHGKQIVTRKLIINR